MRSLSILAVLVVAVVVAALFLVPRGVSVESERALLYPDLGEKINDVKSIVVRHADGELLIDSGEAGWVVPSSHGYPADEGVVRRVLLGLADARIVEPKTSKPELYHRLGVADISEEGSTAVQVIVGDAAGGILASVLVGEEASGEERYVRRANEARSLRVTAVDAIPTGAAAWLRTTIVEVERDEIATIEIDHGEERIELAAGEGGEMNLVQIPQGKQVSYQFALNDFASTIAGLALEGVRPAEDLEFDADLKGRAVTDDGLEIRFETARADDATWFRFVAGAGETASETAATRAKDLNARWDGWAYRLREADLERLQKRRADLLEDITADDAGSADEGAGAAADSSSAEAEPQPATDTGTEQ